MNKNKISVSLTLCSLTIGHCSVMPGKYSSTATASIVISCRQTEEKQNEIQIMLQHPVVVVGWISLTTAYDHRPLPSIDKKFDRHNKALLLLCFSQRIIVTVVLNPNI